MWGCGHHSYISFRTSWFGSADIPHGLETPLSALNLNPKFLGHAHRLLSSSCLGFPYRILNINHNVRVHLINTPPPEVVLRGSLLGQGLGGRGGGGNNIFVSVSGAHSSNSIKA